jgi:flagellar biosynthesis GTPase FlhF
MIKYATTCDNGNSTTQTDTILTTEDLPEGIITENTDLSVYHQDDSETGSTGFAPRMVDHEEALCLSTTLAIKSNGGGEQWSHYIDNQHVTPNVRVVDDCHLYVIFHVNEYPTVHTVRSLAVKVSATWQKEEVELKAIAEANRKAKEEDDRQAMLEAERRKREDEERQARKEEHDARDQERQARKEEHDARDQERQARKEEHDARDQERQARKEEHDARDQERQARKEEHDARDQERQARKEEHDARDQERQARWEEKQAREVNSVAFAPAVADDNLQARIDDTREALGLDRCEKGFKFRKTNLGYECTGGKHKITFAQLGMK